MNKQDFMAAMDRAAKSLGQPGPVVETRQRIVDVAVEVVPGADFSSISHRNKDDGTLSTVASTDEMIVRLDAAQYEVQEGPCYEAVTEGDIMSSEDIRKDPRWPRFGPLAATFGIGSQLALPLRDDAHSIDGLNLYSQEIGAFAAAANIEAQMVVGYARVALGYAMELDYATAGLQTRSEIGMAIGIVMERYKMDQARAFDFLSRLSQNSNFRLRDLAPGIIASVNSTNES